MKTDAEKLSVARVTLQLLTLSEIMPDELRPLIDRTIAEIKPTPQMQPTPETDKFYASFADGVACPSQAEWLYRMQDLERRLTIARAALTEVASQYAGFPDEVLSEIAPEWLRQVLQALTETEQ